MDAPGSTLGKRLLLLRLLLLVSGSALTSGRRVDERLGVRIMSGRCGRSSYVFLEDGVEMGR